jgi:hypothetical protein
MLKGIMAGCLLLAGILVFSGIVPSCTHEPVLPGDLPEICFEREILPVFKAGCAVGGCHDSQSAKGGYILDRFEGIIAGIEPGSPTSSMVYRSITSSGFGAMPPDGALELGARVRIRIWIDQGARQTVCPEDSTSGDSTAIRFPVCFDRDIMPVLLSNCALAGCHDDISAARGYRLTSYLAIVSDDELIEPGNPGESKLYKAITRDPDDDDFMPPRPANPLPSALIDSIFNWIKHGALQENCQLICDTIRPVVFEKQVWPVIGFNCTGCHSGSTPQAGISLTSYTQIRQAAESGPLLNAVRRSGPAPMPPTGALDRCQLRTIELWAIDGYQEKNGGHQ